MSERVCPTLNKKYYRVFISFYFVIIKNFLSSQNIVLHICYLLCWEIVYCLSFILYLCLTLCYIVHFLLIQISVTFKLQYIMYIIRNYVLCKRCTEPGLLQRNTVCENLYTYAVRSECKYVLYIFLFFCRGQFHFWLWMAGTRTDTKR